MSHPTVYAALVLCALVVLRVIRRPGVSNGKLKDAARDEAKRLEDLLPRLLPYAHYGDPRRLMAEVGGVSGLRALLRSCRDLAALIVRQAEVDGGSRVIRDQARHSSRLAWWVGPMAISEAMLRRLLPLWPPVFASYLISIYCQLGCTYEALLTVV